MALSTKRYLQRKALEFTAERLLGYYSLSDLTTGCQNVKRTHNAGVEGSSPSLSTNQRHSLYDFAPKLEEAFSKLEGEAATVMARITRGLLDLDIRGAAGRTDCCSRMAGLQGFSPLRETERWLVSFGKR